MKKVSEKMSRGKKKGLVNHAKAQMRRSDYANAKHKGMDPMDYMMKKVASKSSGKPKKKK